MATPSPSKVILITGASRGIGLAIATHLLQPTTTTTTRTSSPPQPNLLLISRTAPPDSLLQLAKSQPQPSTPTTTTTTTITQPPKIIHLPLDLSSNASQNAQHAVQTALDTWGRLDALILNHGQVGPVGRIGEVGVEGWREGFEVNVFSCVALIHAALPFLRASPSHPKILLTSSGASVKPTSTWSIYGATKATLNHLCASLSKEEPLITTIAIRPGVVDTAMQDEIAAKHFGVMEEGDAERFKKLKAEGKMLRPEVPAGVMARMVVAGRGEVEGLAGQFVSWDDERLAAFQD